MLKHSFKYCAALVSAAATLLAAGPVGSITSSSSFVLRGAAVNVHGVPSWPLASGDDIATIGDSASVEFRDGSTVLLAANSHAMIDTTAGVLSIRLLAGTMTVAPAKTPAVQFYSGAELLHPRPGTGLTVSVGATPKGRFVLAMRVPTPHPKPPPVSKQ